MQGAYLAMGSGRQYIVVIPELDMEIAHKVDLDHAGGQVTPLQWNAILNLVLASSCLENCPEAK